MRLAAINSLAFSFLFQAGANDPESVSVSLRNILQEEFKPNSTYVSRTFKHLAQAYNVRKFDYPAISESVRVKSIELCTLSSTIICVF